MNLLNIFVDKGSDEALLKSLPTENCSEELIKAMYKQGLVQKEVQYKTKSGKIATRKQWVKADEDTQSKSQSDKNTNDPNSVFKFSQRVGSKVKYKGTTYKCEDAYTTNYGDRRLNFKSKDGKQLDVEIFHSEKTGSPNYKGKPVEVHEK